MATSRSRDQRGQTSSDYVGVVAFVAILVVAAAALATPIGQQATDIIRQGFCHIASAFGGGACEDGRSAEDRIPPDPCVVSSAGGGFNVGVTVSFVSLANGQEVMVEQFSDGTYQISTVESGGVGANVSAGVEASVTIDGTTYGYSAYASAEALLAGEMGQTYQAGNADEAEQILNALAGDQVADHLTGPDNILGVPNPINWGANELADLVTGDTPEPIEQWVAGGIQGSAGANALNGGDGLDLSVGVNGFLGGIETQDGYTAYFSQQVSGSAMASLHDAGVDVDLSGSAEVLTAVEFDHDGNPVSVSLTSALNYGDDPDAQNSIQTIIEVPLGDDPVRNAQLIGLAVGSGSGGIATPFTLPQFIQAAQEDGYISQNTYTVDPNDYNGTLAAGLDPIDAGISVSAGFPTSTLTSAEYWNGTEFVENPGCSG